MTELAHSTIGASSMYRWSACPGSVRLSKDVPNQQSVYAEEGTKAHDLAAQWLKTGVEPTFPNEEMQEGVALYVRYVHDAMRKNPDGVFYVEEKFDLSAIHPGCFGTSDVVMWNPAEKLLDVVDFKYGAGILVDPTENVQLKYYALGALLARQYPARYIVLTIVQPRIEHPEGPIRSWTMDVMDLYDFKVDLKQFAVATEDPNAPLVPGEHCRFCPAAPLCPELRAQTQAVAKTEFKTGLSYDPLKLKEALDARDFIKAWLKAVDEFAYAEAEAGRCPPSYKLVAKRANRQWKDEEEAAKVLAKIGVNPGIMYEPKALLSPAKMEKIGVKKSVFEDLVESISSGHTLAPESDKRPAVRPSAKEEFTVIEATCTVNPLD
jgi:hypothetical protein